MKDTPTGHKLWIIFFTFFKISATCLGGGYAALPMMQETFVEKKQWLTNHEMVDIVAILQSLPGIIFVNMGVMVGYRLCGFIGAFVAAIGVAIAPIGVILLLIQVIQHGDQNPYVQQCFVGIRAAVCGLITVAIYKLGKQVLTSKFALILVISSFIALVVFEVNTIILLATCAIIGLSYAQIKARTELKAINKTEKK